MFEYGYIISSKEEKRRIVLGTVDKKEYDKKKIEIDSASFVSSGGFGCQPDHNTLWFIEPKITTN